MSTFLSIGNFALADIYANNKLVVKNQLGGMNFRAVLASAYLGCPIDYLTALGSETIWKKTINKLSLARANAMRLVSLRSSIKFSWHYANKRLINVEIDDISKMSYLAEEVIKLDLKKYRFINICSLGYLNEKMIIDRLDVPKQEISYIFHDSNLGKAKVEDYLKLFTKIKYLFLNHKEASLLSLKRDIMSAGKKLSNYATYCFITHEDQGVYVFNKKRLIYHLVAMKTEFLDSSGAGDIFAGATMSSIVKGETLEVACRMGIALASLSVTNYLTINLEKVLL